MRPHRSVITAAGIIWLILAATPSARGQTATELRDRAEQFAYNLDHEEAQRLLRQAVATEPNNPRNHRALASSIWLNILFRRGAVTVDHYLGSFSRSTVDMKQPPAELDAEFKKEVATAIELAERQVAASPKSAEAHYELGTAVGLQASYTASVEGKLMAGFRAARRSYDETEQALDLDPSRKDAGLIVGTYRYLVSTLSFPVRMMAYVAGFGGGKERGIKMVEDTARAGKENRTDAQFALVLLYNRERRYDDAMKVLADLRKEYPRNRLVLLEAGASATRGSRPADAEALLSEGIAMFAKDPRPKIPGEEQLWHYKRGAARVMLKRRDDAMADLQVAMTPGAAGWVMGRANLEMARLALQQGDTAGAKRYASAAASVCGRSADPICVDEAKKLM